MDSSAGGLIQPGRIYTGALQGRVARVGFPLRTSENGAPAAPGLDRQLFRSLSGRHQTLGEVAAISVRFVRLLVSARAGSLCNRIRRPNFRALSDRPGCLQEGCMATL